MGNIHFNNLHDLDPSLLEKRLPLFEGFEGSINFMQYKLLLTKHITL